jgi:Tetracyclin repressor-like, C-terminal domain
MTVHAYSVQDAYIYGFALQQTDMAPQTPEDFAAEAQRQLVDYADALADYPSLVEVVGGYVATAGYDYEREFLFGLDVILDGLERLLEPT